MLRQEGLDGWRSAQERDVREGEAGDVSAEIEDSGGLESVGGRVEGRVG